MMTWQPRTKRCAFLIDNLDLPTATGYPAAVWEAFQIRHLEDDSTFRAEVKSRQIAWSWLSAAEAVAVALLNRESSVFISINLDEAKEKIRYVHNVIDGLPRSMRPRLITNNRTELEFDNGARLMSLPAIPPRGKAQMNVYLDEFAHVREDNVIYTAALPMITKGNRRLRMASSPMGASGRFWEVFSQSLRKYPGYTRKSTPWWEVQAFCLDVREAHKLASGLPTEQRVKQYGNERIQAIFANMPIEDFQQEYETVFVDETTAWITWEEIKEAQDPNLVCYLAKATGTLTPEISEAIERLRREIAVGRSEQAYIAGVDIGRTRNTTEIYVIGLTTTDTYPLRLALSLDNVTFDDQLSVIVEVLDRLPIASMMIDETGIGRNLAENAERYHPAKVQGVTFTGPLKALWATNAKMLIQGHKTPLPVDKDMAYQFHSIKKLVTASRNLAFDTATNEKHHADKFWAWALALAGAHSGNESGGFVMRYA